MADTTEKTEVLLKPSLHKAAEQFGLTDEMFVNKILLEHQSFTADFSAKLKGVVCSTVPGGRMRETDTASPVKLMIIAPHPSQAAVETGARPRDLLAPIIDRILDCTPLRREDIYCSYAVRFYPPDGKIEQPFITACRPILEEEVRRVNPGNILVLGASSLKGLFGAKGMVNKFYGVSDQTYNGIPVLYTVDPFKLITNPKTVMTLDADMRFIAEALGGVVENPIPSHKDYKVVYDSRELEEVLVDAYTAMAMQGGTMDLALDLEWGNKDGREGPLHDIVRCVQFSWKPHQSVTAVLTDPELNPLGGDEERDRKVSMLKTLLECPGVRLCGHNLKVDILHLAPLGIDCRENFYFDTMTAYHYWLPQTDKIGLEALSVRLTDLGRYDLELESYIKGAKLAAHTKKHGYSKIPDEVLLPYAGRDVDAVMQAKPVIEAGLRENLIDERYRGYELNGIVCNNQLDSYFASVKPADYGIFEPEYLGLPVDRDLMIRLQRLFSEKLEEIYTGIKEYCGESFNPDSEDLRVFLFGERYDKDLEKNAALGLECVPKPSLNLEPVKTTGKYPEPWEDLGDADRECKTPATDSDSLSILRQRYPEHADILQRISDFKAINQVLKNFLRPPDGKDEETGEDTWSSGWIGRVDDDWRIRGTYLQTTETGRFRSLKPNLNNLSANAELDTRKLFATSSEFFNVNWKEMDTRELVEKGLLDPRYDIVRSIVRAPPGYIIVGADVSQAELLALAAISGDNALMGILRDPDLDVHAETSIKAFKLEVPEGENRKNWVKKNKGSLRFAAKSVIFGLIYGRSARAILSQLLANGIDADLDYAKSIISDILETYPGVAEYIRRQHHAVINPGYAENPFGRRRYFFPSERWSVMSAQRRESVNAPIQSCVSEVLVQAMNNFARYKQRRPDLDYNIIMPFHDAVYLEVWWEHAKEVAETVVPYCMVENAGIPSLGVNFKIDVETMFHWGHKVSLDEAVAESLAALVDQQMRGA